MTQPVEFSFIETDIAGLAARKGRVAILIGQNGRPPAGLPRPAREAALRALTSDAWKAVKPGKSLDLAFPAGMQADALQLIALPRNADAITARAAGAEVGARVKRDDVTVVLGDHPQSADVLLGLSLRAYDFGIYKTKAAEAETEAKAETASKANITVMHADPKAIANAAQNAAALAEAVFFTRDLVNEPANVLTTSEFAERLLAMRDIGLEVEVLDEDELTKLGFRALLAVGQGSESPSKVVIMRWNGAGDESAPLALVGKGVVFDTGGVSIKPAAGMEEMTMDMGGAGVVSGVMRGLALRKAKANVVGLVGLVENMPDGRAQRPGDIVRSLKGETIEVINTDAEGRMVLADVLWYAQTRFKPSAVINLATLTGAVIVALGYDNAGVFSNDDKLAAEFLTAARTEGEGAWRLPLGQPYEELIKSRLADIKNTGGRAAGSITAAQFLQHFIQEGTPWVHLDIAGVTLPPAATTLAPKGATGWGVLSLDRLIRDQYEPAQVGGAPKGGKKGR